MGRKTGLEAGWAGHRLGTLAPMICNHGADLSPAVTVAPPVRIPSTGRMIGFTVVTRTVTGRATVYAQGTRTPDRVQCCRTTLRLSR